MVTKFRQLWLTPKNLIGIILRYYEPIGYNFLIFFNKLLIIILVFSKLKSPNLVVGDFCNVEKTQKAKISSLTGDLNIFELTIGVGIKHIMVIHEQQVLESTGKYTTYRDGEALPITDVCILVTV